MAELRESYLAIRPAVEELIEFISSRLDSSLRATGVSAVVSRRAKDVMSVLRKQILRNYADPLAEITDLGGVRVVVAYSDSLGTIEDAVRETCEVLKVDEKVKTMEPNHLGYLGVHYDVRLRDDLKLSVGEAARDLRVEIQVQTKFQSAWAELSHPLLYKASGDLPRPIRRRLYSIVALVEAADLHVDAVHEAAITDPEFVEGRIIDVLQKYQAEYFGANYSPELTVKLVRGLKGLYTPEQIAGYDVVIRAFVESRADKLRQLATQYLGDERATPLLFQPEALLIFERMEQDHFALESAWDELLPRDLLQDLGAIWGVAIG